MKKISCGSSRPWGRLFYCAISVLVAVASVHASGPTMTTISDVVYRANGQPASGTVVITWPTFSTADNKAVAAGELSVAIGTAGTLSVQLAPNEGATPNGTYYKAIYKLSDGTTSTEYWVVPAASPTTIAAIRATVVPTQVAAQLATKQYVDNVLSNTDSVVHKSGTESITGVKSFAVSPTTPDPTTPSAVANKGYVDVAVSNVTGSYVRTTGDTMTGVLNLLGDPAAPNQAANRHYVDLQYGTLAGGIAQKVGKLNDSPVTLASVRYAEQFSGTDWGAKVQVADADLGTNCGEIWVSLNAGTSAPAMDVTVGSCHVLRFIQAGTYALGSSRILLKDRSGIISPYSVQGSGSATGVVFSYTGTGTAIAPATPTALTRDVVLKGIVLVGTSAAAGGINMQAANAWSVEDVSFLNFQKPGAIALWLHSEAAGQQGTYWNSFKNLYFNNVDMCIQLSSDNLTDAPNANYFGGVTQCNSNAKGVNIDQGAENVFQYLAINQPSTAIYGYRNHGAFNLVNGRLEQGLPGGSATAVLYDRHEGNNTNGLGNKFTGTIGNYTNLVQEITGTGTITGTQSNQTELTGGQGFLGLYYNAGQGGGALGLADTVTQFTLASGQSQSAGADLGRIYLGGDLSGQMRMCYRAGGADTCNLTFKSDGTITAAGKFVSNTTGQFQGGAFLDLCTTAGCKVEISNATGAAYPFTDNTQDLGIAGLNWKTIRAGTSVIAPTINATSGFQVNGASLGFGSLAGSVSAVQMPALTGDVTSSAGAVATTLAASGVTAGTYTKITVDAKGRATTGASAAVADLSDGGTVATKAGNQNQSYQYGADSGVADAYAITLSPAPAAYAAGQRFSFKATNANATTTPTINVNALGAKTITKNGGGTLAANDIKAGQIVDVEYDGTNLQMQSTLGNPAGASNGYTMQFTHTSDASPASSTNYYAGIKYLAILRGAENQFYVPKACTVKEAQYHFFIDGTRDSAANNVTFRFDLNSGSSTFGATTMTFQGGSGKAEVTGLSQALAAGDLVAFNILTPTFSTNPTSVRVWANFYCE